MEARQLDIGPASVVRRTRDAPALEPEELDPVRGAFFLDQGVDAVRVEVLVELLKIVARESREVNTTCFADALQGETVRILIDDGEPLFVGDLNGEGIFRRCGAQLGIVADIVDVELDVRGGEWLTIGPHHALAKSEGERASVFLSLIHISEPRDG